MKVNSCISFLSLKGDHLAVCRKSCKHIYPELFCWINLLTQLYMGGGSKRPPLADYLSWFFVGCSKWAQISWLCFINTCHVPLKPFFKKIFWKFEKRIFFFSNKSYFFNLNLHFTCSELSFEVYNMSFGENFQIFIFYYRIPINNQVLSATSHG